MLLSFFHKMMLQNCDEYFRRMNCVFSSNITAGMKSDNVITGLLNWLTTLSTNLLCREHHFPQIYYVGYQVFSIKSIKPKVSRFEVLI